ncbi:MAG: protealysin inhibitor emfourin [Actinomycetota bacterium]
MTDRVKIEFQRSGGFAGTTLATSVDAGDLPQTEAEELGELVERADLPALSERPRRPGGPDRFQYDLAVTLGDRRYQVTVGEAEVPETLRPLLDRLLELARRG